MEKSELLAAVTEAAASKSIVLRDLEEAFSEGSSTKLDSAGHKRLSVADVLYLVGGLIIISGISVLIGQHWEELSPTVRILSTLGAAIIAFVCGWALSRHEELDIWSTAFYIVSSIIFPIGAFVLFDSFNVNVESLGVETVIALIIFLTQLVAFASFQRSVHLVFAIAYGVWCYYLSTSYLLGPDIYDFNYFCYMTLVLGLALGFLAYGLNKSQYYKLAGVVYAAATGGILGAAMGLQGYSPDAKLFWEVIYPVLAFGLIFLSSELKSRSMLVISAIMLMAYIAKLTGEYFSESLGWPLALVLAGLLLMGVGFMAFNINKRYLRSKATLGTSQNPEVKV